MEVLTSGAQSEPNGCSDFGIIPGTVVAVTAELGPDALLSPENTEWSSN